MCWCLRFLQLIFVFLPAEGLLLAKNLDTSEVNKGRKKTRKQNSPYVRRDLKNAGEKD